MRLSTRGKRAGSIACIVLLALLGMSGIIFRSHTTNAASSAASSSVTKSTLAPSTVVSPLAATSPTDQPGVAGKIAPKGPRYLHRRVNANSISGAIPATAVGSGTPYLLTTFNGVGSRASENANFGAEFEPPDQGLCVGNGFVVEPVNSAYTMYRTNGSIVAGPFNVNRLYADGFKQFTSDPRCFYDKTTNTWFAIILFINAAGTVGRVDISVNTSGDPTTPWTVYRLDTTDIGKNGEPNHPGCPCFGDQPRLGIDQYNLYISTDEFSILGPQFNGTQLYALSKADLVSHASAVHFVHFDNLSMAGNIAFGVQPATSYGSPEAEYFMNSLDPTGTTDNRIGVWAMTERDAVTEGGLPTLSSIVISSETYGVPPGAQQKGATSLLDTGDDRMQQVEYINGNVWGTLDTIVNIPFDTTARSGGAWFNVKPQLNGSGNVLAGASVVNQGYLAVKGNYLLYPAIAVSPQGSAAIVMTLSGQNYFPSAVYSVLKEGHGTFGAVFIAGAGTGPYDPGGTRWGDYSYAALDPSGESFWLATEYIPPKFSQTTDGFVNWGTRVLQVSA